MTTQNGSGATAEFFEPHHRARIEAATVPIILAGGKAVGTIAFVDRCPYDLEFIRAKPGGAVTWARLLSRLSPGRGVS